MLVKCNTQRIKTMIPMRVETVVKSSSIFEILFQKTQIDGDVTEIDEIITSKENPIDGQTKIFVIDEIFQINFS